MSANLRNGVILKTDVLCSIVDKEIAATKAGAFDVYKLSFKLRQTNMADLGKASDSTIDLYYAPPVNHW